MITIKFKYDINDKSIIKQYMIMKETYQMLNLEICMTT